MSHWVHCNKCYKQPTSRGPPVQYNLASCGHILCDRCTRITKQACSKHKLPPTCCVCSKRGIAFVAIHGSMSASLKLRFTDAARLWQLQMQKLANVAAHQSQQAAFLRRVAGKQRTTLARAHTCCEALRAQNKQHQEDAEMRAVFHKNQLEVSKQANEALKQENATLKQRIAQLEAKGRARREDYIHAHRSPFGDSVDVSASETSSTLCGFDESGADNDREMASLDHFYTSFGASSGAAHNTSRRTMASEPRRTPVANFPTPSSSGYSRNVSYVSAKHTPTSLTGLKPEVMASYSSKRPASSISGRSGGGSTGYIPKNRPLTLRI